MKGVLKLSFLKLLQGSVNLEQKLGIWMALLQAPRIGVELQEMP